MKTIIFYHRSDLDGHCSGAIAQRAFPDAEMIGIDYGDDIPTEKFAGNRVVVVDFSFQPWNLMQRAARGAAEFIWVDHHATAIALLKKEGWGGGTRNTITTVLDTKFAACELTWQHFFPNELTPLAVTFLGRYDVWDHAFHDDVLPFQMGMRLRDTDPANQAFDWEEVFDPTDVDEFEDPLFNLNGVIREGKTVIEYQTHQNKLTMDRAFDNTFRGLNFLTVNAAGINSISFESAYDPKVHDGVMSFYMASDATWKFSIYSPDQRVDHSEIAKSMGGGGHPFACGFQVDDLAEVIIHA